MMNTEKQKLEQQILHMNALYREGVPVISDAAYDELCDTYKSMITPEEWEKFRDSLHELGGKLKHKFIMGSLDKIKADDPDTLYKFLERILDKSGLHISAKVDGISCRLSYESGYLVEAATRGDGYTGIQITEKVRQISSIPQRLKLDFTGDIRGELVIYRDDFNEENFPGFANPRNATAGIINRKESNSKELKYVKFVAYTILGKEYTKLEQFDLLKELGFELSGEMILDDMSVEPDIKTRSLDFVQIVKWFANTLPYEIDGVVVSSCNYRNEDKYRPDDQIAVKINQCKAVTKMIDVEWQGPSKDGRFVPVAILEPVEIAGTIVSKASLHNADFILNCENLKYGATVVVCKRGDIIPQIDEVLPE